MDAQAGGGKGGGSCIIGCSVQLTGMIRKSEPAEDEIIGKVRKRAEPGLPGPEPGPSYCQRPAHDCRDGPHEPRQVADPLQQALAIHEYKPGPASPGQRP